MPKSRAIARLAEPEALYANRHFKVTPVGLRVEGKPSYEDWAAFGGVIATLGSAAQWAIGDWLLYGEGRGDWGEMYMQAVDETGRTNGGIRNAVMVCRKFDLSSRDDKCSFTHHRLVCSLPLEDALALLKETYSGPKRISTEELADIVRDRRHQALIAAPIPDGQYRVIYADPPWMYATPQHGKEEQETVLASHYPSMTTDAICALPVPSMTLPNSVLFLWATSPLLFEAELVINAWGFDYKASIVWDKVKHNVGHYVSVRHEFLLICTKGSCLPDSRQLLDSVVSIERTEHSRKPEEFRSMIDVMYTPVANDRIELFNRGAVPSHWRSWGNQ